MTNQTSRKSKIIHPFLITAYPVLFLYANNINEVQFTNVIRSLVVVSVSSLLAGLVFRLCFKDWHKAGVALSVCIVMFFSYGFLHNALRAANLRGYILWGYQIGVNTYLLPLWLLVFLMALYWIWRSKKSYQNATKLLNIIAVTLIVITGFRIFTTVVHSTSEQTRQKAFDHRRAIDLKPTAECPDIYFIILDGYVRSDILARDYPRDNTDFISYLQEKGFYVVPDSYSNYTYTHVSLTSTLNLDYLHDLAVPADKKYTRSLYQQLYRNNPVFRALKQLGYEIVSFPTGYKFTDLRDVGIEHFESDMFYLSEFESELFNLTPLRAINKLKQIRYDKARNRILFPLEYLATERDHEHPIFAMAHLLCPHVPFIFGPQVENTIGFLTLRWDVDIKTDKGIDFFKTLYADQVAHLNQLIMRMIDQILARPGPKPIIILQADHGARYMTYDEQWPGSTDPYDPFAILNAIYFPDSNYAQLYDSISPVNTFRVLFNKYFGTDFALLPDHCYLDVHADMYDFSEITEFIQNHQSGRNQEKP